MKKIILTMLLLSLVTTTATAGFEEGATAYKTGNFSLALEQFSRLAEQENNARAQNSIGWMYLHGEGVPQDYAQAVSWFRKAAEQGDANGQYSLGWMYYQGQGILKNYSQAADWFRKAAEQGYAQAQYNLGTMYFEGNGVIKDYAKAMVWFHKAAEQSDSKAQYSLGLVHYEGLGVPKNYIKAANWFQKAAQLGDAQAQFDLGEMYFKGQGVEKNDVVAYAIGNLTSLDPITKGAELRELAAKLLTDKQIKEGQHLTNEIAKPNNMGKAIAAYLKTNNTYAPTPKDLVINIKQGMNYTKARSILLKNGWQAVIAHKKPNGTPVCFKVADRDEDDIDYKFLSNSKSCKYLEIDDCSGTGMGFCSMTFFDGNKTNLEITTAYGEPPDASIHRWQKSKIKM